MGAGDSVYKQLNAIVKWYTHDSTNLSEVFTLSYHIIILGMYAYMFIG